MHSTNYTETFIAIAPDCRATRGTVPRETAKPSVALLAFRLIQDNPYRYTSDDVLFNVHADRNAIPQRERAAARETFFAKPRACLRASDLGKRYGWGIHHDAAGRVALYGVETEAYRAFVEGKRLGSDGKPVKVKLAMRSSR